jgi:hypothetical protein
MKKGDINTVIGILGAITILFFTAYVTWTFIYGGYPMPEDSKIEPETEKNIVESCLRDEQCDNNPNGAKCLDIADPNFPERFSKFCGCETKEDCKSTSKVTRSGVCGQDNKCE